MVADALKPVLDAAGHAVDVTDKAATTADLVAHDVLLVVCATHGSGDIPTNILPLVETLERERPDLSGHRYGVIALGDMTYQDTFCGGGKKVDKVSSSAARAGSAIGWRSMPRASPCPTRRRWAGSRAGRSWSSKLDQSGRVKTSTGSGTPRSTCLPSDFIGTVQTSLNSADASTGTFSSLVRPSRREARLTAGPMTVKSSRSSVPTLPKVTSPTCRPTPKRSGIAAARGARLVGRLDVGDQPARGRQRLAGHHRQEQRILGREVAHDAVADEFQDLAAVGAERIADELQVVVQELEHLARRQALAHAGEVAQVGEPQHGAQLLALAAADGAVQHALADLGAEIGVGHGLRDGALDVHLGHRAHQVDQTRQVGDVLVGEAAAGCRWRR